MTITFITNFINHHQVPLADEFYKLLGKNYAFVATMDIPAWIKESGYPDLSSRPYLIKAYENEFEKAKKLALSSDIVILGSAPEIFIKERLRLNKYTFRYSERPLKQGEWRLLDPRVLLSLLRNHTQYRKKNVFMLCASAYAANDLNLIFSYPQKKIKWGYFTAVEDLEINTVIESKPKEYIQLLWVARFIDWKHPELAVQLALELKKTGYNFHLNMIGTGELFNSIQKTIIELNLEDYISLIGSMPNQEVRQYMQNANIFLFTSNKNEGWGAVLNEAMSNGCAVVASDLIGSVPYLINNGVNGLVFRSGHLQSLVNQVKKLLDNRHLTETLSRNAYITISEIWSPVNAAKNFQEVASSLLKGVQFEVKNGPGSKAQPVKRKIL